MINFISKIDHFVAKLFHDIYLWGGELANHAMEAISIIADAGILFLVAGLVLSLFKRTRKIGFTILFSVAVGFILTNVILKNAIERARPFKNISSDYFTWWLDAGASHEGGFSFPSGHTTATTAFSMAIFLTTNKKYSWPILLFPILMASSRIYLMVHYFSDCVGGLIVGSVAAIIAYIIVKLIYKSKLKLFVWARELTIFKSKQKAKSPAIPAIEEKVEEYVYLTQNEEPKPAEDTQPHLIEQDIKKNEENSTTN